MTGRIRPNHLPKVLRRKAPQDDRTFLLIPELVTLRAQCSHCLPESLFRSFRGKQRQKDRKRGPAFAGGRAAPHANRSVVLGDDVPADPQAQTGTNFFLGREEGFKKMLAIFRWNPWTGIGDRDPHSSYWLRGAIAVARDSNANLPASLYRIDTIAQKIRNELPDFTCSRIDHGVVENFRTNFNSLVATARSKHRDERI